MDKLENLSEEEKRAVAEIKEKIISLSGKNLKFFIFLVQRPGVILIPILMLILQL